MRKVWFISIDRERQSQPLNLVKTMCDSGNHMVSSQFWNGFDLLSFCMEKPGSNRVNQIFLLLILREVFSYIYVLPCFRKHLGGLTCLRTGEEWPRLYFTRMNGRTAAPLTTSQLH